MKVLVTGSAGLIGSQVTKDLVDSGDTVYSGYHKAEPDVGIPTHIDLYNINSINEIIKKTNPDSVIHLAAMTNVDLCEKEKELAMKINAKATEILAKQAAKNKSFFVYVSTDYVFDGVEGMKKESDKPNPVDYYGKSKLEGEKSLMNLASSWCIARTSTPYGLHSSKTTFPIWVANKLSENTEITVVTDQHTSPTYVPNLSRMLIEIARRQLAGIFHVSGATRISRYDMAEKLADKLKLPKTLLLPSSIEKMNWIAKRPKDSSLDVSKALDILKEKPLDAEQGLDSLVKQMN